MSSRLSFLIAFVLIFPFVSFTRPLPSPLFAYFETILPTANTAAIPAGLTIPLAMHTLTANNLQVGGQQFFRVTEDVLLQDVLLFGAGAIACGRILAIEKDAQGHISIINIELVRVQASDGSQVALYPTLLPIHISTANVAGRVRMDAEVQGVVLQAGLVRL